MKSFSWRTVVAATLAVVAAAAILAILVRQGEAHDRLLMEYEASRVLTALTDELTRGSNGPEVSAAVVPSDVVGFGLYLLSGEPLLTVGTAPLRMRGEAATGTGGPATRESGELVDATTLRLIRVAGSRGLTSRGTGGGSANRVVYLLDLDVSAIITQRRIRYAILAVLGVMVTLLAATTVRAVAANRRARDALAAQERLALLGGAARTIMHELRNPLAAIRLQTALARRLAGAPVAEPAAAIDEEVARLDRLAGEVRTFLSEPRGAPERIEVGRFLGAIAARLPFEVRVREGERPAAVEMDPLRLESVISNLAVNAHQSMGDARGVVEIDVHLAGESVVIAIADRGDGLPADVGDRIFDPFFTTRDNGSGVGLSIARTFVRAAGGTLTLAPRDGGGTIASVHLPAASPPSAYAGDPNG